MKQNIKLKIIRRKDRLDKNTIKKLKRLKERRPVTAVYFQYRHRLWRQMDIIEAAKNVSRF